MLRILLSSFIILAENWGPQLARAVLGRPCSFQTWSLTRAASPLAEVVVWVGTMWACFVCLQHVTNRALNPCTSGRPVMKSVVMSFQGCKVASLGLSFLAGFSGNDFILWHWSSHFSFLYKDSCSILTVRVSGRYIVVHCNHKPMSQSHPPNFYFKQPLKSYQIYIKNIFFQNILNICLIFSQL